MKRFAITLMGLLSAAPGLAGSLHHVDRVGRRLEVQGNALVRSFAHGPVDASFGGPNGVVLDAAGDGVRPTAIAVDGAGHVLVAGAASGTGAPLIMRFTDSGRLDQSWGVRGVAGDTPSSQPLAVDDIAPFGDGSVLVLGTSEAGSRPAPAVWRLTRSGTLDRAAGWSVWHSPLAARGLSVATAGTARAMLGIEVRTPRGVEVQVHGHALNAPDAVPEVIARQTLSPGEFVSPVVRHYETRWAWLEGSAPDGEIALVHYLAATDTVPGPWRHLALDSHAGPRSAVPALNEPGGAVFNPWAEPIADLPQTPPRADHPWSIELDPADTAIKSLILVLLGYVGRLMFRRTSTSPG